MATTVSFDNSLSTDSSDKSIHSNSTVAHLIRGCGKKRLRIIPSESDREDDIEISFVLTPEVSEYESDSDPDDDMDVFADDNYVNNKRRKSVKCITHKETRNNISEVSFNCSYSWSIVDS